MAVNAGLLAKASLGLGIAGAGVTTIYFGGEYVSNLTSIYDNALINFLNGGNNDHDIKFDVKKNTSSTLSETDLVLNGTNPKITVSAKVQVSNTTSDAFKKGGSSVDNQNADMKIIQGLNGGQEWTWECSFEFTKDSEATDATDIETEYKDRI